MFELRVAFFKPMWRRIITVVICFGWGLFEFSNGAAIWGTGFFAMGALCAYQFFFAWKDPADDPEGGESG
jgi:hypothetical protein